MSRNKRVTVNLSAAECSTLKAKAEQQGLSLSSYLRMKILAKRKTKPNKVKQTDPNSSKALEVFMEDLKKALETKSGMLDFGKIHDFKRMYKL